MLILSATFLPEEFTRGSTFETCSVSSFVDFAYMADQSVELRELNFDTSTVMRQRRMIERKMKMSEKRSSNH